MTWPIVRSVSPAGGFYKHCLLVVLRCLCRKPGLTEPRAAPDTRLGSRPAALAHLGLETTLPSSCLSRASRRQALPAPSRRPGFGATWWPVGVLPPGRGPIPGALSPLQPWSSPATPVRPSRLSSSQAQPSGLAAGAAHPLSRPSRLSSWAPCLPSTAGPRHPSPALQAQPLLKPSWAAPSLSSGRSSGTDVYEAGKTHDPTQL